MRRRLTRFGAAERGNVAVEYALALPALLILVIGGLSLARLAFAVSSLHYAVQDAARCAAVKTTVCPSASTTLTYAQGRYLGPKISPQFTYSTNGCGHTVQGSGAYLLMLGVATVSVPISATACYP